MVKWATICLDMDGLCCSSCHEDVLQGYHIGEVNVRGVTVQYCCRYDEEDAVRAYLDQEADDE